MLSMKQRRKLIKENIEMRKLIKEISDSEWNEINETDIQDNVWYRGISSEFDTSSTPNEWTWITDQKQHASQYGDIIIQYDFDLDKFDFDTKGGLKVFTHNFLEDYAELKNIKIDDVYELVWTPDTEFVNYIKSFGYRGFEHYDEEATKICIFDKTVLGEPKIVADRSEYE